MEVDIKRPCINKLWLDLFNFIPSWEPLGTKLNQAALNYSMCQDHSSQINSEQGYVFAVMTGKSDAKRSGGSKAVVINF